MHDERGDIGALPSRNGESPAHGGNTSAARSELVVQHLPLVRMIAAKLYRHRWGDAVGFDEYCQMGATGLVEAATRFDAARGVPFGAYASSRIAGSILNGLESVTEQHQQIAARKRYARERMVSLAAAEASTAHDTPEATLARLASVAIGLAVGFMLEGSGMYGRGDESTGLDGAASLAMRQARMRLRRAVEALPDQERTVLKEHYFHHRPFTEVAQSLGVTRGRISQVHRQAVERLRAELAGCGADGFEA